jgi:hypothetical protein
MSSFVHLSIGSIANNLKQAKNARWILQTRAAAPKKNCLNRENLQPQKRPIKDPFEGLQRPRGRAAEPIYHRQVKKE